MELVNEPIHTDEKKRKKVIKLLRTLADPESAFFQAIQELEQTTENHDEAIKTIADRFSVTEQEVKDLFQALKNGDLKGDKGERGEKGDKGDDGRDGKDGISITGKEGKPGKDGRDGRDGRDGVNGVDGKDGSPDMAEDIRNKLELLTDDERLDKSAIKGLEEFLEEVKKLKEEGKNVKVVGGTTGITLYVDGVKKSYTKYLNLVAGSGISISHANPNSSNDVTVDALQTRDGTITRSGNYISSVAITDDRTITVTRNGSNYITSITDGTRTWTYTRNGSNQITSWAVS